MRGLSERLFQGGDPWTQDEFGIAADEEVNVIGHDYVPADGNVELFGCAAGKLSECRVNRIGGEPFLAMVSAKGDEPDRPID